jgi:sialate O-acetylesterase
MFIACVSSATAQTLRLPVVIGDHMVLQRDMPVAVWGWAPAGETVNVSFKGQDVSAKADDSGAWRVTLTPLKADAEPAEMTVTAGGETLTVSDILVGEVWLCSGQSNMEWTVERSDRAEAEIADAKHPLIRHIKSPHLPASLPQQDADARWEVCSPETAGQFTAVGYFFGRKLHNELNVPVGLLNCSWGGTRIEPWTPIEGFAQVPELKDIHESVEAKRPDSETYHANAKAYMKDMLAWVDASEEQLKSNEPLTQPAAFPDTLTPYTDRQNPTTLYNGQMAPFVPYTIRGSIWYQGESNRKDGAKYFYMTKALLAGWRKNWERPDLPYYFVQIAPFQYGNDNPYELPALWEAQARVENEIEHTGMVVVSDIGNLQDIHPTNKQDVGLRLANMALNRTYGHSNILDSGPRYESMTVEGNKLLVTFENAGESLAVRGGGALNCFELAGESQPWTQAKAEIVTPNTVAVTADGIDKPVAVRFGWHKLAEPNLINSAGLPASPFRAGEPPSLDPISLNVPESKGYETVYELDLNKLAHDITYETDNAAGFVGKFDRVAYYLELGESAGGDNQWVYVSMDAFTDDLSKIGIPTFASGATFQQPVGNLAVYSNASGIPNADGLAGNIEFWPNNYGKGNKANVPGATNDAYDAGDEMSSKVDGYGSMQVHLAERNLTLFALNNWKSNTPDLGIGNNTAGEQDWTFTGSAQRYPFKRLKILIRPTDR